MSEQTEEYEANYPFEHQYLSDGDRVIAKAVAEINATGDAYYILQDYSMDDIVEAGKLLTVINEEPFEAYLRLSACLDYAFFKGPREQIINAVNLLLRLGILYIDVIREEDEVDTVFFVTTPKYNPWYNFFR